ncbi:MAG TPA: MaoC family dehydratase [Gammaproteobacteria bacterium]
MAVQTGRAISRQELETLVGRPLGTSDWMTIDQARVDAFADVTEDHQFVHVDPVRAAETPFGGTIAHGLLTLSLIVPLCFDFVPKIAGTRMLLNYGFDKVRFPAPVRVGKRIRGSATLAEAVERKPGQLLMKLDVTIEIENEPKPALTAEWLSLHVLGD